MTIDASVNDKEPHGLPSSHLFKNFELVQVIGGSGELWKRFKCRARKDREPQLQYNHRHHHYDQNRKLQNYSSELQFGIIDESYNRVSNNSYDNYGKSHGYGDNYRFSGREEFEQETQEEEEDEGKKDFDEKESMVILKTCSNTDVRRSYLIHEYEIYHHLIECSNGAISRYLVKYIDLVQDELYTTLIMEDYGESLSNFICKSEFDLEQFLSIAIQVTSALREVHKAHVIHRGIRPQNIMFHRDSGLVKLSSFERSSMMDEKQITHSIAQEHTDLTILSLTYMSPESTGRTNRSQIDYRSDVYSLGATLYELLCGMPPFQAVDALEMIHCHIAKEAMSPYNYLNCMKNSKRSSLVVSNIIMKMLKKNPDDRYQSLYGLLYDLEKCHNELLSNGSISEFPIGEKDFSRHFCPSTKLYGNQSQVQKVLDAFIRTVKYSSPELVVLTGSAGVGKTTVMKEVQKLISKKKCFFISGKYDQLHKNIAYSGIIEAFRMLVKQILSESHESIQHYRDMLLLELGSMSHILTTLVPELIQLIGEQPSYTESNHIEAKNRFNAMVQRFVSVFARIRPLVLYLDDLHWTDASSIEIIKHLMLHIGSKSLILVVSYREKEMKEFHDFSYTIEDIKRKGVAVSSVELHPLSFHEVADFIADSLPHAPPDTTNSLTELVYRRTEGNPLFVKAFLQALFDEDIISQNDYGFWYFDLERANTLRASENLADLMILKISKFTEETRYMLQIASCFGNNLLLSTVGRFCGRNAASIAAALQPALDSGLAYLTDQRFFFTHDKIQEVVYSQIPERKRQEIHMTIGSILFSDSSSCQDLDQLGDLVSHLNKGKTLLLELEEGNQRREYLMKLTRFNLVVGEKAKRYSAYQSARWYLSSGLECFQALNSDENILWKLYHHLGYSLYLALCEVYFFLNDDQTANIYAEKLLLHAQDPIEQCNVYKLRLSRQALLLQSQEAIETAREALSLLDITMPTTKEEQIQLYINNSEAIKDTVVNITGSIDSKDSLNKLIDALPEMKDEKGIMACELLSTLIFPLFLHNYELCFAMVSVMVLLPLKSGITPYSSHAFTLYGGVLRYSPNVETHELACLLGRLAIALCDKNPHQYFTSRCRVYHTFSVTILPWCEPLHRTEYYSNLAFQSGMESGDLQYCGLTRAHMTLTFFFMGQHLNMIRFFLDKHFRFMEDTQNEMAIRVAKIVQTVLYKLYSDEYQISEKQSQELELLESLKDINDNYSLAHALAMNSLILYILGANTDELLSIVSKAHQLSSTVVSHYVFTAIQFCRSLISLRAISEYNLNTEGKESLLISDLMDNVNKNQLLMEQWSRKSPENFLNKYLLVEAELSRVRNGPFMKTIDLYDKAIEESQKNGFIHEHALSNELAGRYFIEKGFPDIATSYIQQAYRSYEAWGATRKTQLLLEQFSETLEELQPFYPDNNNQITETIGNVLNVSLESLKGLENVIASIQSISSSTLDREILLQNLIRSVLDISNILDGRITKVAIVIDNMVIAHYEHSMTTTINELPLYRWTSGCRDVVSYVTLTKQVLVIPNPSKDSTFRFNPYFVENKSKAVACLPAVYQNELKAILYLEKDNSMDAFSNKIVEIFYILSSQLAITLENSSLIKTHVNATEIEMKRALEANNNRKKQEDVVEHYCFQLRYPIEGIHHGLAQIRSSMEAISLLADDSQDQYKPKKIHDSIQAIHDCNRHQDLITTDVLTLSKLEANQIDLEIVEFKPNELIRSVIAQFADQLTEKRLQVNSFLVMEDKPVFGAASSIAQVLTYLLSNAIKFNRVGGSVSIGANLDMSSAQPKLAISVKDTGIGLTPKEAKHIFNRFEQNQRTWEEYGGSGLGLYISKYLCKLMGGDLVVHSKKNEYTIFAMHVQCNLTYV